MPEVRTTAQLADKFQVTPRTVQRWIKSGKLQAEALGRDRYMIDETDSDDTPGVPHDEEEEKRLDALERQLEAMEARLQRLERRKIIIRLSIRRRTETT